MLRGGGVCLFLSISDRVLLISFVFLFANQLFGKKSRWYIWEKPDEPFTFKSGQLYCGNLWGFADSFLLAFLFWHCSSVLSFNAEILAGLRDWI